MTSTRYLAASTENVCSNLSYRFPPKMVTVIKIMYENNIAIVLSKEKETEFFEIITGVLQRVPLIPFLLIIELDCALRIRSIAWIDIVPT